MKKLSKILSVVLSLALCAGLVAPSFAASFTDLQNAIDGTGGKAIKDQDGNETGRLGYGQSLAKDNSKYEIEAWSEQDKEGNDVRNVVLNENVEFDRDGADAQRNKTYSGIIIDGSAASTPDKVVIDLNGKTVNLNPGAALNAEDGEFYKLDADGKPTSEVVEADALNRGSVFYIANSVDVTINDSSTKTYVGEDGKTHYVAGSGTGTITGGNKQGDIWDHQGGGISVWGADLTMNGGSVLGNREAFGLGGGITVITWYSTHPDPVVTLKGVVVSNNRCRYHGGGIYASGSLSCEERTTTLIIEDSVIANNKSSYGSGGISYWPLQSENLYTIINTSICKNTGEDGQQEVVGNQYAKGNDQHVWLEGLVVDTPATCTTQGAGHKVCKSGCIGEVILNIDPNNHDMSEWKVTTPATCEEEGKKTRTCQREGCDYEETEPIAALGHIWGEWETVTLATCHSEGTQTRLCERGCKDTGVLAIDPDNHDGETEVRGAVEATYDSEGYTGDTYCLGCDTLIEEGETIPRLARPVVPTTEIDDVEVPLAGIFTRADAIGYLWQQAGSPEWELSDFADVPEDHEWAVAIGWAQDMGIALADVDSNFRPDDLVLRSVESLEISPEGELQEFLNRCAVYAGVELDGDELFIELAGAWDDVIMGEEAQVIFDEFFAKLETAPAQAA